MKTILVSMTMAFALALSARAADVSTKLTDVHLCCDSCVKGVKTALDKVQGVTAVADKEEGIVTLTGPDAASVQKAADALVAAGYFGKSSNPDIKIASATGAKGQKVQALQVDGVHLCCGKCVKSVNTALESVSGVTTNTATKGAKSFTISGDFNDKEVFTALQKAGLTGQVGK
jgi:copper chaperone CopZ